MIVESQLVREISVLADLQHVRNMQSLHVADVGVVRVGNESEHKAGTGHHVDLAHANVEPCEQCTT